MALHAPRPPSSCFEQSAALYCYSTYLHANIFFLVFSCFIGDIRVFFGAFLGPIFAILLFNIVIFVLVIAVLIKHNRKKFKREADQGKMKTIIRLMCSIVGVMSIFGLAWVFGALTVVSRSFGFQVLFAIFNSLQGFMIFLFFCVISKESRELWAQLLCRGKKPGSSAPFKARKSFKQSVGKSSSTGVRSKTSTLPSVREREASLSM